MKNSNLPIVRNLHNVFLIDWFTVTLHGCHVDDVQSMLGLEAMPWQNSSKFINGYPMDCFFGHIHIRWGADDPQFYRDSMDKNGHVIHAAQKVRPEMGICLDMSGQGCRDFEEFSKLSWFDLFENLYRFGGRINITRLDLAYDDHEGLLDIYRMRRDVEDRNYISKSKKSMLIWSDDQEQDIQGLTLQIGSKSSPVLIRIYNKAAERGWGKEKHWVRVELQLREGRAGEAVRLLYQRESVGLVASGIIRNYCCFVTPSCSDTNKSRWPIAEYWQRVLEGMEKLRVWIAPGAPYNFSKVENHLVHQYGQVLLAYAMIHGGISTLLDRCCHAHTQLKPKYQNAVAQEFTRQQLRRDEIADQMSEWGFVSSDDYFQYIQSNFAELLDPDPECPFGENL